MRAGRPRLTPEAYQARLDGYCARYKVTPLATDIPPFPAGRRETPQHREWIALYKAKSRLARSRADAPVGAETMARLKVQGGLCPICGLEVGGPMLHGRCQELVTLAAAVGPEAIGRLQSHLWPPRARGRR